MDVKFHFYRKIINNTILFKNYLMKNAQCKKCLKKFNEKDIYTIQQFQYRKEPTYEWTKKFFIGLKLENGIHFVKNALNIIQKYQKMHGKNMLKIKFQTLYCRKNIQYHG